MAEIAVAVDTYTDSAAASTNFLAANRLHMAGSGATAFGYVMLTPPLTGADVLYTSAVLKLWTSVVWPDPCTLTGRRVTSSKAFSAITHAAQPTNTAVDAATEALGALAKDALIELDVTTLLQGWASGLFPNYGVRLDVGAVTRRLVYAAQTTLADKRPVLVYEVFKKPGVPAITAPKSGQQVTIARPSLTWTPPTDPLMAQVSYRVQMNQDDNLWTAPDYDSGEVAATGGQHNVDFDIDNGETWFWRVQIKNGGGQWSEWAAGQEFGRTDKPTFSILQPTGGAWTDSTPPVEWSALSAGTQVQYQVQHLVNGVVVVDSGILPGDDTAWTYGLPIPGFDSGEVTTRVSVRDDADRAATPGDSPWIVEETVWTYTPGDTDPVDTIVVTQHPTLPVPLITVTRASAPDRWDLQRSLDGGPWKSVRITDGLSIHTTGTTYELPDVSAPPHHDCAYRLVPGVNGVDAADNPTDSVRVEAGYLWLLDPEDNTFWVALADKNSLDQFVYGEDSEAAYIRGADRPQVTFDGFRGFSGPISGGVYGTLTSPQLGRTAQQMRDAVVLHAKNYPTRVLRFIASDYNVPVIARNVTPILRLDEELSYGISMTLEQYGELPWSS